MIFTNWIREIGISGFLDMAFLSLILYFFLVWFKRTRAAFVLTGIFIISLIYLLTRQFNLVLTAAIFENFFAIFLIALVVIFQEELRNFFERIAVWSLNRQFMRQKVLQLSRDETQILVKTLFDLGREKRGALIVLSGAGLMARHLESGVDLNGELSEGLLKSIFDPHSMGHDGAVIIEGNRIAQYAAHLPLSKNLKEIGNKGTRHTAALGLSELTDALCLVVSEERGTISVAQNGEMETVTDPEKLNIIIEKHYQETFPDTASGISDFFKRNGREKIFALFLAVAVWFVFSHGSKVVFKTYKITVHTPEMPKPWVIKEILPKEIDITVHGPRQAFYFLNREEMKTSLSVKKREGTQNIILSSKNISLPEKIILDSMDPKEIKIQIQKLPEVEGQK